MTRTKLLAAFIELNEKFCEIANGFSSDRESVVRMETFSEASDMLEEVVLKLEADNACAAATQGWRVGTERPNDGQFVAYLFEPFGTYHIGTYYMSDDSVAGKSGFTSWQPEVSVWYPLPPPKDAP